MRPALHQGTTERPLAPLGAEPAAVSLEPGLVLLRLGGPVPADVAVQACASVDAAVIGRARTGTDIDAHPCFAPASGRAMGAGPEPLPLLVGDGLDGLGGAHNYYTDDRRAVYGGHAVVLLRGLEFVGTTADPAPPFSLLLVVDLDGDGVLDDGEGWTALVSVGPPALPPASGEAAANPLPGTWSEPGQCRERVYVFTREGHYFEMFADRTQHAGEDVWSVVKGRYDASTARGSSFTTEVETNWSMHGFDIVVDSATSDAVTGSYVFVGMGDNPDERRPFQYVRCSTEGEWPY